MAGRAALFARATRAKVLPVMLAPVAVGSALAWERRGFFSWGWFGVTLLGAAAMHLGANVVNDYFDEASGAEEEARRDFSSIATGSGVVVEGLLTQRAMAGLAASLFSAALVCGVVLAVARGPAVLWLGAIGFVLAFEYVAPPAAYGYRGRGLGELGIFGAFGVLPVVGSYYVQAGRLDAAAVWASIVPGLLTTLVLYHHHFLHWQSDRAAKKMTPVAVLGPERALSLGVGAVLVTYAALVAQAASGLWPWGAAAAAFLATPVLVAAVKCREEPATSAYVRLLGSTLGASVLTALILIASSVLRVLAR